MKYPKMIALLVMMTVTICAVSFAGTPGVIFGNDSIQGQSQDEALRTGPIAFLGKSLIGSIDTSNIVISTKWTPPHNFVYVCRGIYNNSGTAVKLSVRFVNSTDTLSLKIGAREATPVMFPLVHTIFKLAATDTIIPLLQITR